MPAPPLVHKRLQLLRWRKAISPASFLDASVFPAFPIIHDREIRERPPVPSRYEPCSRTWCLEDDEALPLTRGRAIADERHEIGFSEPRRMHLGAHTEEA